VSEKKKSAMNFVVDEVVPDNEVVTIRPIEQMLNDASLILNEINRGENP
jgi:hypothetical protein